MFYVLSKILDVLVTPIAWAVVLIIAGITALPFSSRRWLAPLGIVVLLVFSLEPVSNALYKSLETPPLRTFRKEVTYDAVILLGGVVDDRQQATWGQRAFNEDTERLLETFDLLKTGAATHAILSGGPPDATRTQVVEANALADQLLLWGIPAEHVIREDRARNTYENAVYSAAIVRDHGWKNVLIVTSAFHMPRAYGCFRAVGLDVDTLPVDFRSFGSPFSGELIPRAEHLNDSSRAIREWVGRAVYRVRGYSR